MTKMKTKAIKMNMRSAVLYATAQINDGKRGFFLTTEFGKVGVEINSFSQVDPLHPVEVLDWQQGPETMWAMHNKDADADYYVSIDIFDSELLDHMAIVEAFSRVMLKDGGFEEPDDNIIQAMIQCYLINYDETKVTINSMVSEYIETKMGTIGIVSRKRMFLPVQAVIREMFQLKISSGEEVIQMGEELLKGYRNAGKISAEYFNDKYCEQVFGIFLYARMKQEKNFDETLSNIVNFKGTKNINQIAVNK